MNNYCVITTINKPTKAVEELYNRFGYNLIVVGDNKTPPDWMYKDLRYIPASYVKSYAPNDHYARKNLGYLQAIYDKPDLIYDTDDDNIPNEKWKIRECETFTHETLADGWYNVYNLFSDDVIWPRGFSLKELKQSVKCWSHAQKYRVSSIQQGLANGEPDVDAIWRLALNNKTMDFENDVSIYLQSKTWCPFNSQSTWWFPKAYPLMYLPVYASFRMTDIWRSFIAQRCLWELGEGVTFHSPSEVFQDRNEHDLLKDFEDEIPGYLNNDKIVERLSALILRPGEENVCKNLETCYRALIEINVLPVEEIHSVNAWIKDYENITGVV